MATVPVVDNHLSEQRTAGFKHVTLDLRDVCFLDSTGLRMILDWDGLSRADGFAFCLVAGPPTVQRIFELTGTTERLSFVDALPPGMRASQHGATPRVPRYAECA